MDSFAILSESELTYIQAAGGPTEGFVLEHQTGSIEQHYWTVDDSIPLTTVVQAFQLYATGDESWHALNTWEKKEISGGSIGVLPVALVAVVFIAAMLWRWRAA